MYKNILVPVAPHHPANTSDAIQVAQSLLSSDGKLTLLTVLDHVPGYVTQYLPEGQLEKNREQILTDLQADAEGIAHVDIKVLGEGGSAGVAILEYAKKHDTDLIIIASHRPGLQDYFLGSTAARVVRHASCAVHVVR